MVSSTIKKLKTKVGGFILPEELQDLLKPPESRIFDWGEYGQLITAAQARTLGFSAKEDEDYTLKLLKGAEPQFYLQGVPKSVVTPPLAGVPKTETQAEVAEMLKKAERYDVTPSPVKDLSDTLQRLYPEEEMTIQNIQTLVAEDPDSFITDLMARGMPQEAETVLRTMAQGATHPDTGIPYTPAEIENWLDDMMGVDVRQNELEDLITKTFPQYDLEGFANLVETDFDTFIEQIQVGGWTKDKESLLRMIGVEDADISKIIAPWWTLDFWKEAFFKPYGGKDLKGKAAASFVAGIGDVISTTGGTARWLGYEETGGVLSTIGSTLQRVAPPDTTGEFDIADLMNPDWYATKITRTIPFALSLAPLAISGYGAGAAVATAVGLGRIGSMIVGGLAGAALSRPLESSMEAGGAYDDAIARGKTETEAKKEADEVFKKNMTMAGMDAFEIAIALAPTPKWVPASLVKAGLVRTARIGGKMVIVGLSEGGEEVYQDMVTRHARGEEWQLDPVSKEVFAIGAVMGLGMGLGGDLVSGIVDKAKTGMSSSLRAKFNLEVSKFEGEGFRTDQSELKALDTIAQTPEGEKVVSEAIKEISPQPGEAKAPEVIPAKPTEVVPTPTKEAVVKPEVPIAKEAWQMTQAEHAEVYPFAGANAVHRSAVFGALNQGKPVSAEVLKDYPDLAKQVKPTPVTPEVTAKLTQMIDPKTDTMVVKGLYQDLRNTPLEPQARANLYKRFTKAEADSFLKGLGEVPKIPKAEIGIPEVPTAPPTVEEVVTPTAPVVEITTPTGEKIPSSITEAPTPTEGATARVFSRIQTELAEAGFVEKVKQGWHKFNIKMVDDLDPIKRIVDQLKKGDVQLSIDENPYLLARLLRGVTSKATTFLEYGTFGKNFYKVDKQGKATPNYTGEPLQNILNEVKDPVKWRDFSTYLTARRSFELTGRDIETGISQEDALATIEELDTKYKNFDGLAKRVYKYQDSLLVYANELGIISKDLLDKLRKYGNYVPFYRVFNELQAKGLFGKKMVDIAQPIKRIKGSEREIINPLESIVKNTYVLISAADRNQVGIAIANLVDKNPELADVFERVKTPIARVAKVSAKELGVEIEGLTETEEEQMVDIFRPSFFVRGDEVTVLIDGKKHYYKVDADLRDSLLRLDRESLGLLGKWLGAPARWLRAGATLSPDFMFRNPARDQMTAFAYSNYGFMPGIDFIRGLASMLRKDADYQLFRMSGAEHSMLVSMDRSYLQKTFKQIVEGKGFTEYVKHPLELFRIISECGEKATRLGEFKKGIQSGVVPLEAGYSARSVTLDFSQAGTTAQAINTFIAFFNANLRGWGKMVSSFKEHPIRTSAKVFMGITLPSILLWAVNHDDDRWKEIPQWQKDLFWIVFVGENIYRIPKPFELGIIFGSVPERFLDWLVEKDPDLMKDIAQTLIESGSPGFIPTAGLPILEWMTNYSFFRARPIVPESRKAMPPELQYTPWTSEVSKKLGELLKLPPAQLDNLMFAWTGGLGRYATDILDGIMKGIGISPDIPAPSPTLADLPVIKAFIVRSPYGSSSEAVNDFYNFLEKYEGGEKYLKEMLINNELEKYNKYKAAHPELFFFADFDSERYREAIEKGETPKDVFYSSSARYLRRVANELSELGKKEDLIYKATDISPEEKRRLIDEIEILKTDVARKAVDLLQQKEPPILQERINEVVGKLGQVIEEATPLSLEKADIFNVPDAYREFDSILEGATVEDLKGLEGIDPLAFAYLKKEEIEKTLEPILNKQIKDIDFNLKEGVTFEDYYKHWQLGLVKDSPLDKISRRQVELLRKYEASDNKKAFLKSLTEGERVLLNENPQKEWLKSHPTENAEWALAGKAPILTKAAYNEFKKLLTELDIPDSAIPPLTLPPEGSVEAYFERNDITNEWGANSWEDKLLRAKNPELNTWLELGEIDIPIVSLELKVKNRDLFDKLDAFSNKDSPDYITDEKDRAEAVKKFKADNPEFVDDMRRIEAIEKGTDEAPTDKTIIDAWVDRGRKIDEFGGGSSEAKVWLIDHPDVHQWALDNKLLSDKGEEWNTPVLRINAKWRELDTKWDSYSDKKSPNYLDDIVKDKDGLTVRDKAQAKLLADNKEYREDRYRKKIYGVKEDADEALVATYVEYSNIVDTFQAGSAEAKTFRIDHPELQQFAEDKETFDWSDTSKWNVPALRIDVKYRKEDAEYQAILDKYPGRPPEEVQEAQDYLANNEAYRKDRRRRDAYRLTNLAGDKFPDTEVENYVSYYELPEKGFRRERLLIDAEGNPTPLGQAMHDIKGMDLPKLGDIPAVGWDDTYEANKADFDKFWGLADFKSINYIEDEDARKIARDAMRYDAQGKPTDFFRAEKRLEAYEQKSPTGVRFSEENVNKYVAYYELSVKGFRQERFLIDNPEFAGTMRMVNKIIDLPYPLNRSGTKVPAVQYDDIYDQYSDQFDEVEGNANPDSDYFEPDIEKRKARDKELRFNEDGTYTEFGLAEIRRNGYGLFVPENHIESYVGYYKIIGGGKPKLRPGEKDAGWYEDDWFMMEHNDFYKEVYLGILKNERKDYREVPTREVFAKYQIYLNDLVSGKPRDDYRWENRDLDDWLVLKFEYTPITGKRRRAELSPAERLAEEVAERMKRIRELREPLKIK